MWGSKDGPWTTGNGGGIALEPTWCGLWGHGPRTTDLPMRAPSIVQYFEKKKI